MLFIEFFYLAVGIGIALLVVYAFLRKPPTRDTSYFGSGDGAVPGNTHFDGSCHHDAGDGGSFDGGGGDGCGE
jgi:hypothetical protein